ncbi:MAG: hypothetical protein AAF252_11655 [Pseudomonadota bacterium]
MSEPVRDPGLVRDVLSHTLMVHEQRAVDLGFSSINQILDALEAADPLFRRDDESWTRVMMIEQQHTYPPEAG